MTYYRSKKIKRIAIILLLIIVVIVAALIIRKYLRDKKWESQEDWYIEEMAEAGGLYNIIDPMEESTLKATPSDLEGKTQWDKVQMGLEYQDDSDTDNDRISDKDELEVYGTDPLLSSTAGDLYLDGYKLENGMDLFKYYEYEGEFEFPFNHSDDMVLKPKSAADHHANVISGDGEEYPDYPIDFTVLRAYSLSHFGGDAYIDMNVKGYKPDECVYLVSEDAGKTFESSDYTVSEDNKIKIEYGFDNSKSYTIYLVGREDYENSLKKDKPNDPERSRKVENHSAEFTVNSDDRTWSYYINPKNWFKPSPHEVAEIINTYGTTISYGNGWLACHFDMYPHIDYVPFKEAYKYEYDGQDLTDEELESRFYQEFGKTFEEADKDFVAQHLDIWQRETNLGRNKVIDETSDTINPVSLSRFVEICHFHERFMSGFHNTFPVTRGDKHEPYKYYGENTNKYSFVYMWFTYQDLKDAARRNAYVAWNKSLNIPGVNDDSMTAYLNKPFKERFHSPLFRDNTMAPTNDDFRKIFIHVFPFHNFITDKVNGVCAGMSYLEAYLYNHGEFPATGSYDQFKWNLLVDSENQTLTDPELIDYKTYDWVKQHCKKYKKSEEIVGDKIYTTYGFTFDETTLSTGEKNFVECMQGLNEHYNSVASTSLVTDKTFNPMTSYDRIETVVGKHLDDGEMLIVNVAKGNLGKDGNMIEQGHSMLLFGLSYETKDQEKDTAVLWVYDPSGGIERINVRRAELDTIYGKKSDAFSYEYGEYSSSLNLEYGLEVWTDNYERIL